ncbi:MAG TPA: CBS domain-containing protein [Actinomycetota bacterium]|jgi:CBS domain-containing protein
MPETSDYVSGIMSAPVVTVAKQATVAQALRAMIDHDFGAVVVTDGSSPVGVFTERDLTRRILEDPDLLEHPVADVMSSPLVTVAPGDEVVFVFQLMSEKGIRRLPVLDGGKLVGIVTERDLLTWVDAVATS